MDGHVTHVKNLEVIDIAQNNGVVILCFPPHCTHKMQPLDVGFNGALKSAFGKEVSLFQRKENKVTLKNVYSLFGNAYIEAAKMKMAINSFKKCGIYPYDPNVFASDFASKESAQDCDSSLFKNKGI